MPNQSDRIQISPDRYSTVCLSARPINSVLALVFFFIFNLTISASATSVINYQGRILNQNRRPIIAKTVTFDLRILTPDSQCVLFAETLATDMSSGDGGFSLVIGRGLRTDAGVLPLEKLFDSHLIFPPTTDCPSGYTRQQNDELSLQVSFNDGTGPQTLTPIEITAVPTSMGAHSMGALLLYQLQWCEQRVALYIPHRHLVLRCHQRDFRLRHSSSFQWRYRCDYAIRGRQCDSAVPIESEWKIPND
jgi:hypothetical protein